MSDRETEESTRDGDDSAGGSGQEPEKLPEEESEWQFTVEDIEARQAEATAAAEARERRTEPIDPGDPSLENTVFVLLGVLFTLFVLSRLVVG